ncbi:PilZ domain-containing protein [Malonomonas rubra]|uniref:PilZ domain-containing protein n=1 Tax=Malonomonas rubra TaxID=57040 RepID=UPI0026F31A59|nr:PilZ domain-containing protein [Malonomonas rubra]
MAEKRDLKRKKKRLKLRFGVDCPKRIAFTEDLSDCGVFVITGQPERPGTKLLMQITLPDEGEVIAHGRVQWAKKVPPNMIRVAQKCGMGVRFLSFESGEESYRKLIDELRH